MTNDEVHSAIVRWIASVANVETIKDHQGIKRPSAPYIMVNYTGSSEVREHAQNVEFTDTGLPNSEGKTQISAAPVIEVEWRFSVHAYGPGPTDRLRPIVSAVKLSQVIEPLLPALVIHELSQIRNVPDMIENAWEPRAQMDIFVRGLTRDGFVVDTIDVAPFTISKNLP
ncbi:phage neck terminator protein [Pararhizobium sp.]|uniref:phage neck terminator protein n=1 Tax=Pararhizobium sp. TaxID=1977563 RepID=UPI00271730C4|nr:hypothetical protein [Pararhizobium sp.]MDO9417033.1 hypothetical protein [Pararhizobium sp.]